MRLRIIVDVFDPKAYSGRDIKQARIYIMTSVVGPAVKKSIADMMEEELYHLPNSPTHMYSNRSDSPKPLSRTHLNSMGNGVSGAGGIFNGHGANNNSASSLTNFLNIPDSMSEQQTRASGPGNSPSVGANANASANTNASVDVDMAAGGMPADDTVFEGLWAGDISEGINPFRDYGNPDSWNTHQQKMGRGRRITTLDEDLMPGSKNFKDKDYFLFDPDTQPSLFIGNKNILNEDYLYSDAFVVPNEPVGTTGVSLADIQLGYMDQFDEDVEEEISDDDDDDYFFDDFDDMMYKSQGSTYFDTAVNPKEITDDYSGQFEQNIPQSDDDMMLDDDVSMGPSPFYSSENSQQDLETSIEPQPSTEPSIYDVTPISKPINHEDHTFDNDYEHNYELDDEHTFGGEYNEHRSHELHQQQHNEKTGEKRNEIHKTAAEISAINPNHQCDLINPATGQVCNKQFSRPYDLIRHQETIHAAKKKIFRCVICEGRVNGGSGNGKLKTFSRGDALSRHIKVKHGLVGKEALNLINEAKENVEYVTI